MGRVGANLRVPNKPRAAMTDFTGSAPRERPSAPFCGSALFGAYVSGKGQLSSINIPEITTLDKYCSENAFG